MAEKIIDGNLTIEIKKSTEEMRFEEHEYQDANGWCAVCGRSEGWRVHDVKEAAAPLKKVPSVNPETDEPIAVLVDDDEDADDLTTGPLESPDDYADDESI